MIFSVLGWAMDFRDQNLYFNTYLSNCAQGYYLLYISVSSFAVASLYLQEEGFLEDIQSYC